jgi:hypothetical protein
MALGQDVDDLPISACESFHPFGKINPQRSDIRNAGSAIGDGNHLPSIASVVQAGRHSMAITTDNPDAMPDLLDIDCRGIAIIEVPY